MQISSSFFFNEVASLPDYQINMVVVLIKQMPMVGSIATGVLAFMKMGLGGWGTFINDEDPNAGFNSDGTLAHPYSTCILANCFT